LETAAGGDFCLYGSQSLDSLKKKTVSKLNNHKLSEKMTAGMNVLIVISGGASENTSDTHVIKETSCSGRLSCNQSFVF